MHGRPPAKNLRTSIIYCLGAGVFGACLVASLFPVYRGDGSKGQPTQCLSNIKGLATAIQLYAADFDDSLPSCRFSEGYGQPHGPSDPLISDSLAPFVKNHQIFVCPSLTRKKPLRNGTSDYFCVHDTRGLVSDSSPLLRMATYELLGKIGKARLDLKAVRRGDERRKGTLASYFACGNKLSTFVKPAKTPVIMCDLLSSHGAGPDAKWEVDFLPKELGGTEKIAEAGTNVAFADSHAKFVKGNYKTFTQRLFRPILEDLGVAPLEPVSHGDVGGVLPFPDEPWSR